MTIRDNRDYIRDLLYSYYITIPGWGVLLRYREFSVSRTQSVAVRILVAAYPKPQASRQRTTPKRFVSFPKGGDHNVESQIRTITLIVRDPKRVGLTLENPHM